MKKLLVILLSLSIFAFCLFFIVNLSPVSSEKDVREFVVNQGEGLSIIGSRLQKNNFIRNKYIFIAYSYFLGLNKKLQAGSFRITPSSSTSDIIRQLSQKGSHDYWLKIIDGYRLEEIAASLPDQVPFSQKEFLAQVKDKEGSLFPDSYLIPIDYSIDQIIQVVASNFNSKLSEASQDPIDTNLSQDQSIILASLLEREAKSLEDKQLLAGILLNRLQINMALQVDATVQFAKDSLSSNLSQYWKPITGQDTRQIDSPYNTYKYPGLPPSPICNPGYNSIYAAFHPVSSDYLFYITGKDGNMYYAKTLDQHNTNISKYLK